MSNSDYNNHGRTNHGTWGIVPAAGVGSRMQPLAISKELLPVGSRLEEGIERPRAVSEYLVERLVHAGASKLCFVISPSKADIMQYYGSRSWGADIVYTIQPHPLGLCDAVFRAVPLVCEDERVVLGLPDTVWFPEDAFKDLAPEELSLLLFPVQHPENFDSVSTDEREAVTEIQVKCQQARSRWIWGAMSMPGHIFHALHRLWLAPNRRDEYLGTLLRAWIDRGGTAVGVRAGREYIDAGTIEGYRAAMELLHNGNSQPTAQPASPPEGEQANAIGSISR